MQSLLKLFSFSTDKTNGLSKGYLMSIPSQNSKKYLMFIIFLKVLYFAIGSSFLDYLFLKIGEGNGNPLQYSCLENPMDRGAWTAIVHGVAESDTTEWQTHFLKIKAWALFNVKALNKIHILATILSTCYVSHYMLEVLHKFHLILTIMFSFVQILIDCLLCAKLF